MAAQDIEYIELYTSDERSALEYFASSFGFVRVAESADGGSRSSLLRQGAVRLVVTAGRGTEEFLEAHGDGVVDIAFTCDNIVSDRQRAVSAGALPVTEYPSQQTVTGFFGTRHTLVPRSTHNHLPAGRTWVPVTGAPVRPTGRIRLLDHVAICVEGGALGQCADLYSAAFGLTRYSSEYIEVGDQAMVAIQPEWA